MAFLAATSHTTVYSLYGLRIAIPKQLPFPEYRGGRRPHIEFRESSSPLRHGAPLPTTNGQVVHSTLPDGSIYLSWEGLFEFVVSGDGRRIDFRAWTSTVRTAAFEVYGITQALSFALLMLEAEPVHATTLTIDDKGIGFIGQPGAGKSTLAAALLRRGGSLLSDDLMVTRLIADAIHVMPGVPRLKLFPEIGRVLMPRVKGRRIHQGTAKLVYPLPARSFEGVPARLDHLYVLREGDRERISVRPLSPRSAFLRLTENTFNPLVTGADRLRRHFVAATELATTMPVGSVTYARDLSQLDEVCDAIMRDAAR